jgi:hypothetical protein
MTVVRRRHNGRFASLPNAIWEDPRLTVEAKGVLGYLLSRPHNWNVRPQQVGQVLDIGKDKLQRIFRELIAAGYVTREQNRDVSTGSFGNVEYVVRDECVTFLPQPENPEPANPQTAEPQPVNTAAYKERILQKTESTKDDADDAREPLINKPAMELAEQLLVIAGHDPKFWPPGWCGAPMRVQTWLNSGWAAEIIIAATRSVASRKTGPPAASVQFF